MHRGEFENGGFAGADVLFNRETAGWILDDEIVRRERRHALEREFDRLAFLDDQMGWFLGVAVEDDGGALDTI